ncbi:MAG TPA: hypothetical protein VF424_08345 [Vicinamibacterales bacterium]
MPDSASRRALLSNDTGWSAEQAQVEIWRAMTTVQIAELIVSTSNAARTLAIAGLRERYPGANDHELLVRYVALTLGPVLARRVYPEFDRLEP